jgi:hypothetical protein
MTAYGQEAVRPVSGAFYFLCGLSAASAHQ